MDDPPPAELLTYLDDATDAAGRSAAAASLCNQIVRRSLSVAQLAQSLKSYLTSLDATRRSAGTRLLAEVVKGAAEVLESGELHFLCEFLCNRLSDWPCVEAAAHGCLALISRPSHMAPLAEEDGVVLIQRFAASVQVQPLAQSERHACLTLWLAALQAFGVCAARAGRVDLVDATIAAVDGEKDPRCLMLSFLIVQAVSHIYHSPGVNPSPLEQHAEEVAEVLSCYFPVTFSPPKNDPHKITRQELELGLEGALASSPFLAKWVLPLVLEKLSSTYKAAKEDALSALNTCCAAYGREAVWPHLQLIWSALRAELMAPSAPGLLSGPDLDSKLQLATSAARCLTDVIRANGQGGLDSLALRDPLVSELFVIVGSKSTASSSASAAAAEEEGGCAASATNVAEPGRERHVLCVASIITALASASPEGCTAVCSSVLPGLLPCSPPKLSPGDHSLYLLSILCTLIKGVAAAVSAAPDTWLHGGAGGKGDAAVWLAPMQINAILHLALDDPGTGVDAAGSPSSSGDAVAGHRQGVHDAADAPEQHGHEHHHGSCSGNHDDHQTGCTGDHAPMDAPAELQVLRTVALHQLVNLHAACLPHHRLLQDTQLEAAARLLTSWLLEPLTNLEQFESRMEWGRKACLQDEALGALSRCLRASDDSASVVDVVLQQLKGSLQMESPESVSPSACPRVAQAVSAASALCCSCEELRYGWTQAALQVAADIMSKEAWLWTELEQALLLATLNSISREVLPLWVLPVPAAHAHICPEFATKLLERVSCLSGDNILSATGVPMQAELAQAVAVCVSRLVASSSAEDQRGLAVPACTYVAQYQLQLQEVHQSRPATSTDGYYRAAAACAALAGMLPGVLSGESVWTVVNALLSIIIPCPTSQSSTTVPSAPSVSGYMSPLQSAASVALSALLNKWPDGQGTEDAVAHIVNSGLMPHANVDSGCMYALAWCTRGLAMRGHPSVSNLISTVVRKLNSPPAELPSQLTDAPAADLGTSAAASQHVPSLLLDPVVIASAQFFRILLLPSDVKPAPMPTTNTAAGPPGATSRDASSSMGLTLEPSTHARCRPLWLQRTFMMCVRLMGETNAGAGSASSGNSAVLLGTAYMVSTAPLAMQLQTDPKACTSMLTSALGELTRRLLAISPPAMAAMAAGPYAAAAGVISATAAAGSASVLGPWTELLHDCLLLLLSCLANTQLCGSLEEKVSVLLPCLCSLARLPSSVAVRGTALQCLIGLMELPYHLLHPHRQLVLKSAVLALDDGRRGVRHLAVKCRRLWGYK